MSIEQRARELREIIRELEGASFCRFDSLSPERQQVYLRVAAAHPGMPEATEENAERLAKHRFPDDSIEWNRLSPYQRRSMISEALAHLRALHAAFPPVVPTPQSAAPIAPEGVHSAHCCEHYCKYAEPDCPVVAEKVTGIFDDECADCHVKQQRQQAETESECYCDVPDYVNTGPCPKHTALPEPPAARNAETRRSLRISFMMALAKNPRIARETLKQPIGHTARAEWIRELADALVEEACK